jgi:hypothetical protein
VVKVTTRRVGYARMVVKAEEASGQAGECRVHPAAREEESSAGAGVCLGVNVNGRLLEGTARRRHVHVTFAIGSAAMVPSQSARLSKKY